MHLLRAGTFVVALSAASAACFTNTDSTGGDAGPSCQAYQVPAGTDLTKSTSFKNDVLPVFVQSCAFSGCHNENSQPHVFLGSKTDPTRNTAVRANIVGVLSGDLPTMPFVTPGDPSKSFLMRKMDGDQCMLDAQCVGKTCSGSMPDKLPLLDVGPRDVVRRWILQGALDN